MATHRTILPSPPLQSARVSTVDSRREELKDVWKQASGCVRCPELAETRQTVVFGAGSANADLMFVGEAPGANEDQRGLPFVGRAGGLLDELLAEIGLQRDDVFIANVLKCRPPGNRDPLPQEIDNCQEYLFRQLELIQPKLVCTLGNFATKLLRNDPATGITRLHGRAEVRTIGPRVVRLYPLFHPAAALYTPKMVSVLREDFARIPELLASPDVGLTPDEAEGPGGAPAAAQSTDADAGSADSAAESADADADAPGDPAPAPAPVIDPRVTAAVVAPAAARRSADATPDPAAPAHDARDPHPDPAPTPPDSEQLGLF